jgi:three-Cys-motif partner protein
MKKRSYTKPEDIGPWTEIKLDIIRRYADEYSKILSAQKKASLYHVYIDAFSGAGMHESRTTGDLVDGSPIQALKIKPPFREYFFIDYNSKKIAALKKLVGNRHDVHIYKEDCNTVLLKEVFPKVRWEDYRRGLCLLDPYELHLNWEVIADAGGRQSIEIFLNFPIYDINLNVLRKNPEDVDQASIDRMTAFWGDDTWRKTLYTKEGSLFGWEDKVNNDRVAELFRRRLKEVAGFKYVPKPLAMKNSNNSTVYYLFYASQNSIGEKIAKHIFKKYRT